MNKEIIFKLSKRVYDILGFGLSESAYQTALKAELEENFNDVQVEYHVSQYYTTCKGRRVQIADLRIDILINNKIILELKSVGGKLTKNDEESQKKIKEYKQWKRYQQLKNVKEGYLINFGEKGLDFIPVNL